MALELHELGVAMMRQRLMRQDPDASEATITARLNAWLQAPPDLAPPLVPRDRAHTP